MRPAIDSEPLENLARMTLAAAFDVLERAVSEAEEKAATWPPATVFVSVDLSTYRAAEIYSRLSPLFPGLSNSWLRYMATEAVAAWQAQSLPDA